MIVINSENLNEITEILNSLNEDNAVPKNIKIKIQKIVKTLKEDSELSIKINKALDELDEIADDANLQSYTRTQVWNAVSVLEKMFQKSKGPKD